MGAETLRRAAALMRERARVVPESPWFAFSAKRGTGYVHGVCTDLDTDYDSDLFVGSTQTEAVYIASWHPAVALAVANWLDSHADIHVLRTCDERLVIPCPALAVARAYLGEQ